MRLVVIMLCVGVVGAAVGAAAAVAAPYLLTLGTVERVGGWTTATGIGTRQANPYLRAWVARHGIWALPREEAMYFSAETDAAGRALRADCTYRLTGGPAPARWWSVTAYRDDFWMANAHHRYSLTSVNLPIGEDGSWRAVLGPEAPDAGAWLPMDGQSGRVALVLRLYRPEPAAVADPRAVTPPAIERVECR